MYLVARLVAQIPRSEDLLVVSLEGLDQVCLTIGINRDYSRLVNHFVKPTKCLYGDVSF